MFIMSLVFGLFSWVSALGAVFIKARRWKAVLVFCSSLLCCACLVCLLLEIMGRAYAGDFAGIEDTIRAILVEGAGVAAVSLVLNGAALKQMGK